MSQCGRFRKRPCHRPICRGERAAPTQPIPTRPPPFEYQGVSVGDVIAFTEDLKQGALEILEQYRIGPIYTPPSLPGPDGKKATLDAARCWRRW